FWEADETFLRVAIPDKDLIYDDVNGPPTVLWRLGVDGSKQQIGSVRASFFGLPRWSSDGSQMVFLRRVGDHTSNQFNLVIADGMGKELNDHYASGETGSIGAPEWIPNSTRFIYPMGDPGSYWSGSLGADPVMTSDQKMFSPHLIDDRENVYATAPADT